MKPTFSHAEPVLTVSNIGDTVKYWQEVLGFPDQWTFGNPPTHGGVSLHGAFIQFTSCKIAEIQSAQNVWIRVRHIEALYQMHQEKGVEIVRTLQKQLYGFDEYVIRDLNGHYITFASPVSKKPTKPKMPASAFRIAGRAPTFAEYRTLTEAVGWTNAMSDEIIQSQLDVLQYAVVAEDPESGKAIGCALLIGDGFNFYYLKDVMVHPDWQGQGIGTAIMQNISNWLNENVDHAMIGLFASEILQSFYQQFNFQPAFGMLRIISPNS